MNFLTISVVLGICGLAAAGNLYPQATSYTVITKHEPLSYKWKKNDWKHYNNKGYAGTKAGGSTHYDHEWPKHDNYNKKHNKYEFKYGVKDLKTGDIKNQWEHRDGDHVKGSYSLKEADGTTRIVEYTADDKHGFNAVVKHIGHVHQPDLHSKPKYSNWKGNNAHYGYNSDYNHGPATSYVYVKHY